MRERVLARLIGKAPVVLALLVLPITLRAQHPGDLTPRDKTEVFIQHLVKVARVDPARYQALVLEYEIGTAIGELAHDGDGADGNHEACPEHAGLASADFIQSALEEMHPAYADALRRKEEGKTAEAREAARSLAGKADPYLAAHSNLLLAEIDFAEAADPAEKAGLEKVIASCERILEKDRLYLIQDHRACELIALAFEKLEKPLHELVQYALLLTDYEGLPPEVEARAKARIAALDEEAGRPLGLVADWMNSVEKLLAKEVTAKDPTQEKETEIVSALDKLIELQEARERKACSNCGSGNCRGACKGRPKGSRSMTPARMSAIPQAGKGEVLLHGVSSADPSTLWGLLKERDASRALQSFQGRLPARYERLLEQYYRNLSRIESGPGATGPAEPAGER
jgi:hypothetical protein